MPELEILKAQRQLIEETASRFETFINGMDQNKVQAQLPHRFKVFQETYQQYVQIQQEIHVLDHEESTAQLEVFEEKYFTLMATATQLLARVNTAKAPASNDSKVKLPKIELPHFEGKYEQWLSYSDSFEALIDTNTSLSDTEKLHYLRASLRGEALTTIESLELKATNYAQAWNLLKQRYQNIKLIVHNHIKGICELPSIKNKSIDLRNMLDGIQKHVRALTTLKRPVDQWDDLLIYIIISKFDYTTHKEWEEFIIQNEASCKDELPTIAGLIQFLQNKCHFYEKLQETNKLSTQDQSPSQSSTNKFSSSQRSSNKQNASGPHHQYNLRSTAHIATQVLCPLCKETHRIFACKTFIDLSSKDRRNKIKSLNLCFNCLKPDHISSQCKSGQCKKCQKSHNTLLHEEESAQFAQTVNTNICSSNTLNTVLLGTALVDASDYRKQMKTCRVLLDSGSESNLVTERTCEMLKLKSDRTSVLVEGIGKGMVEVRRVVHIDIKSRINGYTSKLSFLVVPEITRCLPQVSVDINKLKIPQGIQLADPQFHKPRSIDMLIGAELCYEIEGEGKLKVNAQSPIFKETKLGWIVVGRLAATNLTTVQCHLITNATLNDRLKEFWQLEEVKSHSNFTPEEQAAEEHFKKYTTRLKSGRFMVRLPFKENVKSLGESKSRAQKRLQYLESKLKRNSDLLQHYKEFMDEYINLKHMVPSTLFDKNEVEYFMPHHAVIKDSSLTTKLRVVFDASAKTSSGKSLNDILMVGPVVQEDLINLLLRFRTYQFVITADVEKMYRQILVHPDDLKFQQILWKTNFDHGAQAFQLQTITYGTACAPYLATRCLNQLALEEVENFPTAAAILQRDFYVDDLLTGTQTKKEAIQLSKELNQLLKSGCFNLRKWRSNDDEILQSLKESSKKVDTILTLDKHNTTKTLGVLWNCQNDSILYQLNNNFPVKATTKRLILGKIAQIYDPLGLLGPVITYAKLILQQLWREHLDWDEVVTTEIQQKWNHFETNLQSLNKLIIPRNVMPSNATETQLHGFSDASQTAYGACIYVRTTNNDGHCSISLLIAKSKLAPLKPITIPRLELCAALLLTRLVTKVNKALVNSIQTIHLWTDSKIVLAWLASPASRWKTFVANRVGEIQEVNSSGVTWHYVPSNENPADLISRGLIADQLIENSLWWSGPSWLAHDSNQWPDTKLTSSYVDEISGEQRTVALISQNVSQQDNQLLSKFSSWSKLKRVVAYCLRFTNNCRKHSKHLTGHLSLEELDRAIVSIVQIAQLQSFSTEINFLTRNEPLNKKSPLLKLHPYLDKNGIIRVGGRLNKAFLPVDQRNPIVLPKSHILSSLIMQEIHLKLLHCGPEQLLYHTRLQFWPIGGRNMAKKIYRNCITCIKFKPKLSNHIMGDLPTDRVTQTSRPFVICGVDYAGPIQIKESHKRGRPATTKAYIVIFVCMATTAVHIELVSSLTTEAFLAALRRFIHRRGLCSTIISDNASNFIGANNYLKDVYQFITKNEVINAELQKQKISWKFIPPRSPHFGGLWEAAVKAFKRHFYKVTQNLILTYEECNTLLIQIESILNSRPLIPLPSHPSDPSALTPSHFIIGDSLLEPVDYDYDVPTNQLSRWQHVQKIKQHFWNRWKREYLQKLQSRSKWTENCKNLMEGDLVLVADDNMSSCQWKMGRITRVFPGQDKVVRVCEVKTANGTCKRPVNKLCLLPLK